MDEKRLQEIEKRLNSGPGPIENWEDWRKLAYQDFPDLIAEVRNLQKENENWKECYVRMGKVAKGWEVLYHQALDL